ncbi:cadherin-related family member 5 isoform X2 [Meriones unguiculatus]|uniref:cadherin-related family member 5 isoform X2 n=1 Tax=Meriones unguiculatus TaxID=10047 RepID=UPI000B4F93D5|nr:cadherin-related family member 5 isoform X2 [Meriones unguiculatus]
MGAPALLWLSLLLPSLVVLFEQSPGTLAQAQACEANQTFFQIEENTNVTGPLASIFVPEGQQVILGSSSTPSTFKIVENQLFLTVIPDYEENSLLEAVLECRRGNTVVSQSSVFVAVLDVNDNPPIFPFTVKNYNVTEDTKVGTTVIPGTELEATDADKDDVLFYTLQEVTPDASTFFSLVSVNYPSLRLDRTLNFYRNQNMTFKLVVRDTWNETAIPSHTATATLVLTVLPADQRPPWFLPCSYLDDYYCVQAQYYGVVPTGHILPSPVTFSPGPIYAVDGDQAINQPIIYSIVTGNTDDTFIINADSGNLTMTKSIPSPMSFTLIVRADQADMGRYSVTQAIVVARNVTESPVQFSQSLYHGTVALYSGPGTTVKNMASPSEILKIQARYLGFPGLNSAFTYQVTNSSEFKMQDDTMLTNVEMKQTGVFYVEVEATNTVTKDTATTVVEIRVSEVPSTEPPGGGGAGGGELGDGQRFSTVDMAVLGGVLGALLLLALIGLVILIHKHYRHRLKCCSGKAAEPKPSGYDNLTFLPDDKTSWSTASNPQPEPGPEPTQQSPGSQSPMSPSPTPPSSSPPPSPEPRAPGSPKTVQAGDGPSAVRSILTKERRPEGEGGYKAVWFGKDIGADADVVVVNEPTEPTADSASGSEGSDDDDDLDRNKNPHFGHENTYI